eukprot:scaffold45017_cov30-Tisochrysis_lutea.AAC.3
MACPQGAHELHAEGGGGSCSAPYACMCVDSVLYPCCLRAMSRSVQVPHGPGKTRRRLCADKGVQWPAGGVRSCPNSRSQRCAHQTLILPAGHATWQRIAFAPMIARHAAGDKGTEGESSLSAVAVRRKDLVECLLPHQASLLALVYLTCTLL